MAAGIALLMASPSLTAAMGQDVRPAIEPANLSKASARPQVSFKFDRQGLPVPRYNLSVHDDATGVYEGEELPLVRGSQPSAAPLPKPFRRVVNVSPPTAARIFSLAHNLHNFNTTCASKAKNIADTGTKVLTYFGADGSGSCTYNFTENKNAQALTDIFQGIAETMDEGRRLDSLRRYDRLGLDAAIAYLAQEVSAGHALELGTIAESLRSIAADPDVMERARTRANKLLALIPAAAEPN